MQSSVQDSDTPTSGGVGGISFHFAEAEEPIEVRMKDVTTDALKLKLRALGASPNGDRDDILKRLAIKLNEEKCNEQKREEEARVRACVRLVASLGPASPDSE